MPNTSNRRLGRRAFAAFGTAALALAANAQGPIATASGVPISGPIEKLTIANPADHWSAGVMTVGGTPIVIPRNFLIDLPANRITLQELFAQAPDNCVAAGESGLAAADTCRGPSIGHASVLANRLASCGLVVAGDVVIDKGPDAVAGLITSIDYAAGAFTVNGNTLVRFNDPDGIHTLQQGPGCAGGPNCSPDIRYTADTENYTFTYTTGYPGCVPSSQVGGNRSVGANSSGEGDAFCPHTNRTVDGLVPNSTRFAPVRVGDWVTAEGNMESVNGVSFLSAHTILVGDALFTQDLPTQPDYLTFEEAEWDAPGFQNERLRVLLIGFSTLGNPQLDVEVLHHSTANEEQHVVAASTVNNPITTQVVLAGGGAFKIRYDIDFINGAPVGPRGSACANVEAAGVGNCPTNSLVDELKLVSPITREIIAVSRHAVNPGVVTRDIQGLVASNGAYLTPNGIGHPEFGEIDIDAIPTPFIFEGEPWNLDRRLGPGGCDGDCESTRQPLDPFPASGLHPSQQAAFFPAGAETRPLSYYPFGESDVLPFPAVNGCLSSNIPPGAFGTAAPPVIENLVLTQTRFTASSATWRLSGTLNHPGSTITAYLGTDTSGPVIGSAVVAADGSSRIRVIGSSVIPPAGASVTYRTTQGTQVTAPVRFR